jgi:hypothetical protein
MIDKVALSALTYLTQSVLTPVSADLSVVSLTVSLIRSYCGMSMSDPYFAAYYDHGGKVCHNLCCMISYTDARECRARRSSLVRCTRVATTRRMPLTLEARRNLMVACPAVRPAMAIAFVPFNEFRYISLAPLLYKVIPPGQFAGILMVELFLMIDGVFI